MQAKVVPAWQRPIEHYPHLIHLAPTAVHPSDSLQTVVAAFASDPGARLVFVTDTDDPLLGAVTERRLDADLVRQVLPQPLWPALGELDTRDLMRAAQGKVPTADALMTPCISAQPEGSLGDAAITMIRESQPVLALVDDTERLLGYVSLFEILTNLLREAHP